MSRTTAETMQSAGAMPARKAPGPRGLALLRAARAISTDPLGMYESLRAEYGDVVGARLGWLDMIMAFHPDGVGHVLHERHVVYHKDNPDYRMLRPVLGDGLVTANGDLWRRQRRLIQPAFHRQRVEAFGTLMTERALGVAEAWERAARAGTPLDVAAEMMRLTLEIATSTLFGVDGGDLAAVVREQFTVVNRRVIELFSRPWMTLPVARSLPTPGNLRARRALRELDAVVHRIIVEKRAQPGAGDDLLSMLLEARDEEGGMSDRQLRDEVMTMLLAGHETTANALAWTFHLLSRYPFAAERLRAELDEVLGGRAPTVDDLPRLEYCRMVIEESMRLYPPVWTFSRTPREPDAIQGFDVPVGAVVIMSPWITHRHPAVWEDPERFDPERFTPERAAQRPRFAYIPFAAGPRQCIGSGFAMTETQLVLGTLAQRFRLQPVDDREVVPEPLVTLRPRGGLPMRLQLW